MTWRACSARLTVSSAPGDGGRWSTIAAATSRSAVRTAWTRARSARGEHRVAGRLDPEPIGAFEVDDAAIHEPAEGRIERRELLERETILGVVGVQEVEGVVEMDLVSMAPLGDGRNVICQHVDNHSSPVDRLRASGYCNPVTDMAR